MRKCILTLCMLLCGIGRIFVVRNCEAETLPQGAGRFSIEEQAGVLMAGAPAKQIAEKNAARLQRKIDNFILVADCC